MHWFRAHVVNRRNLLLLVGALVAASIFWYVSDVQQVYAVARDYLLRAAATNHVLAGVLFVALAAASAVLTFFTSTPIIPVAIDIFGRPTTLLLIIAGWFTGGVIAYWVCYYLRRFVERLRIFSKVKVYEKKLLGRSDFFLILFFRLMVPSEIGAYTLGVLQYPFWKFALVTLIGEAPYALIATYSSVAFVGGRPLVFVGLLFIGLLVIGIAAHFFYLRLRAAYKE